MTVHTDIGNQYFNPLKAVKTDFVFPIKQIPVVDDTSTDIFEPVEKTHQQQSDLYNSMNKLTIELLEKALEHVRKYDSMETASQLTAKAYHRCPSMYNKRLIVDARNSLRAALKADKWANSRRRKRHVDESTVRRNVDTFFEKISEAVASIRLDLDKRSLNLFSKIKKQYESSLPLTLPNDKKFVKKNAHVVAMCESKPNDVYKYIRLEGNLYLLQDVFVVGINRNIFKNTLEKAEDLVGNKGKTVYEKPLSRPSDNIDWYIIQDFGTHIKFVSFADKLEVTEADGAEGSLSYEGYIKKQFEEKKAQEQLKTNRLATIRRSFAEENIAIYDDIKKHQIEIDNLIFARDEIKADFNGITGVVGEDSGLDISQSRRIYQRSMEYRQELVFQGYDFATANAMAVKQRIEAKTRYYDHVDISHRLREIRLRIKFLNEELENRKLIYARKLGLVSPTKYIEVVD